MSTITSLLSTSLSSSAASSSSSSSELDTDDFLQLLVSQLQNQNPLDPTDTNEFMSQMMSYASYSQQTDMNSTLLSIQESLSSISSAIGTSA